MAAVDVRSLSVNELHALIEAAELTFEDCPDKEALQKRAAEAIEKAPQQTAAVLKSGTNSLLQKELEKKRRVLEEVKDEMRELVADRANGEEPPEGLEDQLKEEIIFLEDQIHKLEDALNMQSKVDKLRQRLEDEKQKLEELAKKEAPRAARWSATEAPEEFSSFEVAQMARDRDVLEDSIARIQENIAQQVLIEDLENDVLVRRNDARAMQREIDRCKSAVDKSKLKKEKVKLEAAQRRAEQALCDAQEATVIEMFNTWDKDGSGSVSCEELKKIFMTLGLKEAAIDAMFHAIDENKNGEIELQEFINWTFAQK